MRVSKILTASFLPFFGLITLLHGLVPEKMVISAEIPPWVRPIEVDVELPSPENGLSDGVYYLLSDEQVDSDEPASYKHFSLRLISAEGVEDYSSVSVTYDSEHQSIVWHRFDLIRDGERRNLLPNQNFRFSSNQDKDSLIYDQRVSATAIIEGTKKGDVIEYAYSILGANPIAEGRFTRWFSLDYSVPVARVFTRIVRDPKSPPLDLRIVTNGSAAIDLPKAKRLGDDLVYELDRRNVEAVYYDEDIPDEYAPYAYLHVSDWGSWAEVSRWGTKLYRYDQAVGNMPKDLQSALEEWKSLDSNEAKALAALRWVQDEVRYVSIMMGPHNYKPYTIEDTLGRGFGDCKDKSQLLCYLLNELGIEAAPTLVDVDVGHSINNYLPAASNFDHVITRAVVDGTVVWLDPTRGVQGGGLYELWHPDFGWGLVLSTKESALVRVKGQGAKAGHTQLLERLSMDEYNSDVRLEVLTTYAGYRADSMRAYFLRQDSVEIERDYLNYYAQQFPDISLVDSIEYTDDFDENILITKEQYLIKNAWIADEDDPSVTYLYTYPEMIRSSTFLSDTRIRSMPALQSYPLNYTQVIEVILPSPGTFESEDVEIKTDWFRFENVVRADGKRLTTRYEFENLTRIIPAKAYPEYSKKIDDVLDALGYSITYTDSDTSSFDALTDTPHIASYLSLVLGLFIGGAVAKQVMTKRSIPPKQVLDPSLDGLSGWLILPAIGIVLGPFYVVFQTYELKDYFSAVWIRQFTDPGMSSYIAGFEWLLMGELFVNGILFCLTVSMFWVFIKKRAIARPFYLILSIFSALIVFADTYMVNFLMVRSGFDPLEWDPSVVRPFTQVAVWGTYFMVSVRAKSTFRH